MSGNVFWREENMSDDDILWLVELVEYTAKVQAVAAKQAALAAPREERAAIVKWLRSEACFKWLLHNMSEFIADCECYGCGRLYTGEFTDQGWCPNCWANLRGDDE